MKRSWAKASQGYRTVKPRTLCSLVAGGGGGRYRASGLKLLPKSPEQTTLERELYRIFVFLFVSLGNTTSSGWAEVMPESINT